jgi:hypothetical protein
MAVRFEIVNTFTKFAEKAPGVLRAKAVEAAQKTTPRVLARMEATAPRLTGEMASKLTVDGGIVGIFDPEQAAVALYNEYSPNHQPFMRAAAQASVGDLVEAVTAGMQDAEAELTD